MALPDEWRARWADALPDWSMLDGCLTGGARPMDIDGCIERNGRFLWLEWKSPDAYLADGQLRALKALQRSPGHTVLVVWGTPPDGPVRAMSMPGLQPKTPADLDTLRTLVADWWRWATEHPAAPLWETAG